MLAEAKSLVAALKADTNNEDKRMFTCREDLDLDDVIKFCCGKELIKHEILYSDGVKRTLSFTECK